MLFPYHFWVKLVTRALMGLREEDIRFPPEKSDCSVIFQFYICIIKIIGAYERRESSVMFNLGFPISQQEQRKYALNHINNGFCVSDNFAFSNKYHLRI